jgi:hypothetical protein
MVLADWAHERRLRAFVSDGFGKPHFLPQLETVELIVGDAVAVEVDLAAIGGGNEAVISLWNERANGAMRLRLVNFDVSLPLAHEVLQLAARGVEGIRDRNLDVLVPPGGRGIAAYGNIRGAGDRQVDTNTVRVTLVMAMLRAPDDDSRRRDAIEKLLELPPLLAHPLLDVIDVRDVLEGDL